MQARALALVACVLLFVSGALAAVSPQPGYLLTVAQDDNTRQVHALLFDPVSGKTLPSAPIAPWWPNPSATPHIVVDANSAFGDWFVHEDGTVFYMLFISNNAEARSQRLFQFTVYTPAQGWFAPSSKASCLITDASSLEFPAISSVAYLSRLGSFVGFTDFKLQPSQAQLKEWSRTGANSTLGLVSVYWNSPQCFQYPLMTFAQGLPLPLPVSTSNAIHQGGEQFAYVRALEQGPDGLQARMVLLDISSPRNATLVPLEDEVALVLDSFYADEESFAPTVMSKEPAGKKTRGQPSDRQMRVGHGDVAGHPSFLLVQSFTTSPPPRFPVTPVPPPIMFDFCEHRSFHPPQTADGAEAPRVPFFPKGGMAMAAAATSRGDTVPMLWGMQMDPQSGWSAFGLGPFEASPLTVQGRPMDRQWEFEAQTLAFIPTAAVNANAVQGERIALE